MTQENTSSVHLTPKQQALMDFLGVLATTSLTPELLTEGNQLLDAAADECRQQRESLEGGGTNAQIN
jgi:hypothetical protein